MSGVVYEGIALIDTSAVIAHLDPTEQFHAEAKLFFETVHDGLTFAIVNVTSHETFTRVRYDRGLAPALERYDFLRKIRVLPFVEEDEVETRRMLQKYDDQRLSYHDTLCAAVMKRVGIYKVFSFDADFWIFGFWVLPGATR